MTRTDPPGVPAKAKAWLPDLAFQAYTEPGRLTAADLARVAGLFHSSGMDSDGVRNAGRALNLLISSPLAELAISELLALLRESGHSAVVYEGLRDSLRYAVYWRRWLLDPADLARLASLDHLRGYRQFLLEEILEPCLFRSPDHVPDELLAVASPYCRYCLGQPVAFPLHHEVAGGLAIGRKLVLAIHNIDDGQGDEIIRTVPLLQALLDYNPELEVTLYTKRRYLYSHPRLAAADIRTPPPFQAPYDAVIDFFETHVLDLNHNRRLEEQMQYMIREYPPFLLVCSPKAYNQFVYGRIEVGGRSVSNARGLNQRRIANNYEPGFRLMAELGLPVRIGENLPKSELVLAGLRWEEAERAWEELTQTNAQRRPVAILLPWGGSDPLKGHTSAEGAGGEMRRLIELGYFVVLIQSAEPWGSAERAREALGHLSAGERSRVALAPDPKAAVDRDVHGRMLLYFTRFADRIVAVEGWMIHAAYCLAKPYEILMHSFSQRDWQPYGATHRQEITQTPEQPRKFARVLWLEQTDDPADLPQLRAAITDPDRDVRAAAACGLSRFPLAEVRGELTKLLEDPAPPVRANAAQALLADNSRKSEGGIAPKELLQAHVLISRYPPAWDAVLALGPAARPALEIAAQSDDAVVRREAAILLRLYAHQPVTLAPIVSTPGIRRRSGLARMASRLTWHFRPNRKTTGPKILILTPMKDAADCLSTYCNLLLHLTYPHRLISVGLLESDSRDGTYEEASRILPELRREFRRAGLWKRDFGYHLPPDKPRWAPEIQAARRAVISKSRNSLLFHALDDEDWVLWVDVDVIEYPGDILEQLLATGKDIVHPHCVKRFGGPSFDHNAWRNHGRLHLDDLRAEGELVELHAVGGTMLLVRADAHREGLIFPASPYGRSNPRVRPDVPELDTEGLGLMAHDMGYQCWGMPHLEIRHRDQ